MEHSKDADIDIAVNKEQLKTLYKWRDGVDKKLDDMATNQRIEMLTMFITIATVLISNFA